MDVTDQTPVVEPLDDDVDHVRGAARRARHPRVRRLRVSLLAPGLSGDRARRAASWRGVRFAFRHFPLTEIHPHALAAAAAPRRPRCRIGSGRCTAAVPSPEGARGRRPAALRRRARARRRAVRQDRERRRRPGRIASRCREREAVGRGSRHADAVHRRRRAPGRLRHGGAARGGCAMSWPALPDAWRATCDTLHAHTQVLGKLAAGSLRPSRSFSMRLCD